VTAAVAPAVRPPVDWRFPGVRESRLDNGIRLLTAHCPGQYVVHASLLFDVPLNAEPRPVEGVAALVARCLPRGAAGLSADDFSDALAAAGAELEASAAPDCFIVRLSVPESHLRRGLELMALAVTSPSFGAREFEQERRLRLQEIDHALANPTAVTVERLNASLFGSARAARPKGGSIESVSAVARDDLVGFSTAHLQPADAVLILAGDFEQISPEALAERTLGGWSHRGASPVEPERPVVSTEPRLIVVDWPDSSQATVRIAGPGITRGDARWPALFVANYAVGGSFGSRLNTVLREQKGLTYGIGSTLDTGRDVGVLGIGASVSTGASAEAVGDILAMMADARGTLTDDEVATGVRAAADSAPLSFERAEAVVGRVEMLVSQRLPLDHVDTNLARIRHVTTDAANDAYRDVVRPEVFTVVVAADASSVADPLGALRHAPVEVVARLRDP
jgi:predicted Zn-dependent peptidase